MGRYLLRDGGGRLGIVLQARMGSTRLPGKVAKPLAGVPMLVHALERLKRVRAADAMVVATSSVTADDAVAALAISAGAEVFRGSESDVLDRFVACARSFGFARVIRATGDNPFIDFEEAERLIDFHLERGLEYASSFPEFGSWLPVGVGVEIMTVDALERSWREGLLPHHREHVNEYIQENPRIFRQACLEAPVGKRAPELRLTVDTPEDLAFAERLLNLFDAEGGVGLPTTSWLIAASRRLPG